MVLSSNTKATKLEKSRAPANPSVRRAQGSPGRPVGYALADGTRLSPNHGRRFERNGRLHLVPGSPWGPKLICRCPFRRSTHPLGGSIVPGKRSAKHLVLSSGGPEKEIPFSVEEYEERLTRVRKSMANQRIDLLYLSAPESLCYISGYQAEWYQAQSPKSFLPASGIAVHVDHDKFILFDYEEEALLAEYTSVSPDTRIFSDEDQRGMLQWVVRLLKEEGWIPSTVGLEMRSYRPNREVSEAFQRALEKEGCRVVDGTDVVRRVRSVKSRQEMAYTEEAARIADIGMRAAMESIRPGVTELEVYGEIICAMAKAGGENPGITIPVVSGPKSACLHALASRRKIQPGDIVNVDLCGVFNRYHANLARTLSLGTPHPDVAKVIALSARSFDVLRKLIRPNLPVAELNARMKEYYQEAGILADKWWIGGYELGIAFPPDWVGSFVYDPSFDSGDARFVPGTVVNYESNFYLPQRAGVSMLINTVAFTETQAKLLSEIASDLVVVD